MEEKALGRPKIMGTLDDLQKVSDGILQGSNASLDTFKEVGIALGNDPNFSTNITKQITVLSDDRGYFLSPEVTNLDNVELNGKYRFRSTVIGIPRADNGVLDVTAWDTNLGIQEITYSGGDKWQRTWTHRNPLTFTPWKQIATTDTTLPSTKNNNGSTKLFRPSGVYAGTFTDLPPQLPESYRDGQGILEVRVYGGETFDKCWREISFKSAHDMTVEYKMKQVQNIYFDWTQVATTDKIDITLLNGWVINIGSCTLGVSGNLVTLNMVIASGVTSANTIIAKIPTQYAPTSPKYFDIKSCGDDYIYSDSCFAVYPNRDIALDSVNIKNTRLIANVSWVI